MNPRGIKQYAVMALKDEWSKPRFVHDPEDSRLLIYAKKEPAKKRARQLHNIGCTFGKKNVIVRWIVVAVWTETMTRGYEELQITWIEEERMS